MIRRTLALGIALAVVACGGAAHRSTVATMTEMDQVRAAPGAREGAALAPQAFGRAEQERQLAQQAQAQGDDVAASLYAERAIAAYNHALVLARLARAEKEKSEATAQRDDANDQLKKLEASRAEVEREADSLEKQVKVAREMLLPAPSGPASPEREAARKIAARSLGTQARLLCGSAKLLSAQLEGLAQEEQALAELDKKLDAAGPAPIDDAARARASCLALLTKARRDAAAAADGGATPDADTLLAELSSAGGWDPSRDERGVVITLRDIFAGSALNATGDAKIRDLGRIAAAHPRFAIQVVVHDATAPSPAEATADSQRADAIVKALVAAGANATMVQPQTAGAKAPIVDPSDAKNRARNARVEIVFVAPAE